MNWAINYVRPVVSLDACHLKYDQRYGTLYVCTVKSALDEIFPVAFGLSGDNENYKEWQWFLNLLK
jgi:hypothetical protein